MSNTESLQADGGYRSFMVQASFTKGFWRSAKTDSWRKAEKDTRAACALPSTSQQAASTNLHTVGKKKNKQQKVNGFANRLQIDEQS